MSLHRTHWGYTNKNISFVLSMPNVNTMILCVPSIFDLEQDFQPMLVSDFWSRGQNYLSELFQLQKSGIFLFFLCKAVQEGIMHILEIENQGSERRRLPFGQTWTRAHLSLPWYLLPWAAHHPTIATLKTIIFLKQLGWLDNFDLNDYFEFCQHKNIQVFLLLFCN